MPFTNEALNQFMLSFERNTAAGDPATVITQFADTFIAAGPAGPILVPAAAFAQMLPTRRQHFLKAGLRATTLAGRQDTRISDRYALVDSQWQMDFAPDHRPQATIHVKSSFLIDMGEPQPKILVYLSHQDIFQLIQEQGLIPSS